MPTTLYSLKGKKMETKILNDLNDHAKERKKYV